MARIKLRRVDAPDPADSKVWLFDETHATTPAGPGLGDIEYVCAGCDWVLFTQATPTTFGPGFVWKCPRCGTFSQISGA